MIEHYDHDDYVGDDDEIEPIYNMHSLSSQSKGNSRVKAEKCTALQGKGDDGGDEMIEMMVVMQLKVVTLVSYMHI